MNKGQKDQVAIRLAVFGSVLSVTTAIFSAFQWWGGQRDIRINAAIDISRKYIEDGDLAKGRKELFAAQQKTPTAGSPEADAMLTYIRFLEYVSYLANTGRVDDTYLIASMRCDIWQANVALKAMTERVNKKEFKFERPDITRFSESIVDQGTSDGVVPTACGGAA
jgi:hypothetical protein